LVWDADVGKAEDEEVEDGGNPKLVECANRGCPIGPIGETMGEGEAKVSLPLRTTPDVHGVPPRAAAEEVRVV
jgi:hypothetical protein